MNVFRKRLRAEFGKKVYRHFVSLCKEELDQKKNKVPEEQIKANEKVVYSEMCEQLQSLTKEEIEKQGAMAKVNPPLRTRADVEAILEGLEDGTLDCIITDHAPHTVEEKARELPKAPSGMVGLETALAVALTYLYHTGEMALSDILRRMTINPACILRLPTKGRLAIGSDSDVVIFDPDEAWTVDPNRFASKGRNTPFAGKTLRGKVKYTIVGGEIVYWEGE